MKKWHPLFIKFFYFRSLACHTSPFLPSFRSPHFLFLILTNCNENNNLVAMCVSHLATKVPLYFHLLVPIVSAKVGHVLCVSFTTQQPSISTLKVVAHQRTRDSISSCQSHLKVRLNTTTCSVNKNY